MITSQLESFEFNANYDLLIVGDFNINYLDRNSSGFRGLKEIERKFLLLSSDRNFNENP